MENTYDMTKTMININIKPSVKANSRYSMFVSFEYNPSIVEYIKTLPYRYYMPETKTWEIPVDKFEAVTSNLADYGITVTCEYANVFGTPKKEVAYEYKTKPYSYQEEGFEYGMSHDKWLLADEQGLGKTKQVIDIAVAKKAECGYQHCLIICCVNGLKWNWKKEVATHSYEDSRVLGEITRKNGKVVVGSNADKLADLNNIDDMPYFIITNIETMRNEEIADVIAKLCTDGKIGMVAVDEFHRCKNQASQQSKGLLKAKPDYRVAMTGTPIMNKPLDLYVTLKWLGYEGHSFYSFKNHYCEMGGFGGHEIIGYKHLDELINRLHDIMLRRRKDEVLDLPEKIYINEYVEMTDGQRRIYNEVMEDIIEDIDRIKLSTPNPLSVIIRLRQATGFSGILSTNIQESAKLDRMEELIEDAVDNGRKVVVFSNWTQITDVALKRLQKYHPVEFSGNVSESDRKEAERRFQNDDDCKVLVGTIKALGAGFTLTAGTVVIFLDEPWTDADKEQAIDRCHRIGTKDNVTIYTLLTKDTVDERVNDIVMGKAEVSKYMIDGKPSESHKNELIDYLLS